ncbi:MAG: aminotransferase class I/II-fold pyridoxal phosphate-dependent enzyme [Methyloligellaceae bacterium]
MGGQRRALSVESPFGRLAELLDGIEPGLPPIDLAVGGPRHPWPKFISQILHSSEEGLARYPAIKGSPELCQAIAAWLARRYPGTGNRIDPDRHVMPLCGTREGLFYATFPAIQRRPDIERPVALIPNPFYQTYAASAHCAGAEPVYLPAGAESGFLPDLEAIDPALLERTAVLYLCSPSNPQGAVAKADYLAAAAKLARAHDFMLFADECYSEIYTDAPPPGALESGEGFANVVSFQSLSKRSNLPGLRSGFCAGDADFIAALTLLRNVAGPQMPIPVQEASRALWEEESHVEESRALYREKFAIADAILGGYAGYSRPQAGFFLWLDMAPLGGGVSAVKTLWKECGVRLLPGSFLSQTGPDGSDPGENYVRLALVASPQETREALERIARLLERPELQEPQES